MTDFLTHLAARTLAPPPAVQPRIVSTFAPNFGVAANFGQSAIPLESDLDMALEESITLKSSRPTANIQDNVAAVQSLLVHPDSPALPIIRTPRSPKATIANPDVDANIPSQSRIESPIRPIVELPVVHGDGEQTLGNHPLSNQSNGLESSRYFEPGPVLPSSIGSVNGSTDWVAETIVPDLSHPDLINLDPVLPNSRVSNDALRPEMKVLIEQQQLVDNQLVDNQPLIVQPVVPQTTISVEPDGMKTKSLPLESLPLESLALESPRRELSRQESASRIEHQPNQSFPETKPIATGIEVLPLVMPRPPAVASQEQFESTDRLRSNAAIRESMQVAQAPTIQVRIGRIEVRAVSTSSASPPARSRTPTAPRLSLEGYLRSRNGGQ
jgi:hypothetical protein